MIRFIFQIRTILRYIKHTLLAIKSYYQLQLPNVLYTYSYAQMKVRMNQNLLVVNSTKY